MKNEYRGEVWQDGMKVAVVSGRSYRVVNAETARYAALYSMDGPVDVRHYEKKPTKRWKRV